MSEQRERIGAFFDRKSEAWDGIYSGRKNPLARLKDKLTRKNIGQRLAFTLRAGEPWQGRRVLDVGCGSGRYSVEYARRGAAEVVGVDLSAQMLEIARGVVQSSGCADRCRFVQADIESFSDAEGFDVIAANGFFDYVQNPDQILAQLRTVCRGTLVASFPARWALRVPLRWAWLTVNRCYVRFYTEAEIRALLERGGFRVERLERTGPIYCVSAR